MVTYTWRKFDTHRLESKEVKQFLLGKGYQKVKVGHKRGTAWGWLDVSFVIQRPLNCQCTEHRGRCSACADKWSTFYQNTGKELMEFTGRRGDYHGDISIDIRFIDAVGT